MKTLTKKQEREQEKERAKTLILDLLNTGADHPTVNTILKRVSAPTVYTILRRVSASGMSRDISLKVIKGGEIYDITYSAGVLLDMKLTKSSYNSLRVNGCGMDMGFHLVYELASVLFSGQERAGYKIRQEWL